MAEIVFWSLGCLAHGRCSIHTESGSERNGCRHDSHPCCLRMDSGLSPPTRSAPDLVHEGEEGTTGWYGWEEAKPRGERELILKCSPTKGCPSHSFPMPCAVETQAPPNFDAPAKSMGQWSPTLNLKVWSWVKGTPPTKKLGETEDSLRSALSQSASEQKLC